MGAKSWADLEVLTAADLNAYLMSQAVPRFPNMTELNAAIGVPAEGQLAYVTGRGVLKWDGAAWGTNLLPTSRQGDLGFNVKDFGAVGDGVTDDTAALRAAYAAATAVHGTVLFPAGTYIVTGTLSLAGYSCSTIGAGANYTAGAPSGTVIKAVAQTGPVMDFTGFVTPQNMRGRLRVLTGVHVVGDGTADPTKAKSGIKIASMSSALFSDIAVSNTGGPCMDLTPTVSGDACYLSDFERITLSTPVSAKANDVPYFLAVEPNGNRFRGIGLRSTLSAADTGASGAVVIKSGTSYTGHDNLFDAWWFEFLHVTTNGSLFAHEGNSSVIRDFQFFDCSRESGTTNTSYIRLNTPAVLNLGANIVHGLIPGKDTGAFAIDTGVLINQSRNTVVGAKGYKGANVTLAAGVTNTTVQLTGSQSGASDLGWVDNSGATSNHLVDEFNQVEVRPPNWALNGAKSTPRTLGVSTWWYTPLAVRSTLATVVGTIYAVPFTIGTAGTLDRIAVETSAAGTAGALLRLGIYADDGTGRPGALLVDAGTVDATPVAVLTATISLAVATGDVWLACAAQGAVSTVRSSTASLPQVAYNSSTLDPSGFDLAGYRGFNVNGALPATFPTPLSIASNVPRLYIRRS